MEALVTPQNILGDSPLARGRLYSRLAPPGLAPLVAPVSRPLPPPPAPPADTYEDLMGGGTWIGVVAAAAMFLCGLALIAVAILLVVLA